MGFPRGRRPDSKLRKAKRPEEPKYPAVQLKGDAAILVPGKGWAGPYHKAAGDIYRQEHLAKGPATIPAKRVKKPKG